MPHSLRHWFTRLCFFLALSSGISFSQSMMEPQVVAPASLAVSVQQSAPMPVPLSALQREKMRLGPGDLVEVSIYGVTDFRQESRINETGDQSAERPWRTRRR
jgi:protein involved in polysaccharide export with SLBB domain